MGNIIVPEKKIITPNSQMSRRQVLRMGATGLVTLAGLGSVLAQRTAASTVVSTPHLEEGPYWVNETGTSFHRSDVRANIGSETIQPGLLTYLNITVSQIANGVVTPLKNAFVYIWSASALGIYSDETAENSSSDTYLRGYQITNTRGSVQFLSLYPGWYSGRTIHTHVRIRLYPNNDPTQTPTYDFETQLFYDDNISNYLINNLAPYSTRKNRDTTNSTDRVYSGGSLDSDGVTSNAGALTLTRLAEDGSHAVAAFNIILNLSLTETTG
jgi:protocatechuate 3,4-dioxygenase beta subunit